MWYTTVRRFYKLVSSVLVSETLRGAYYFCFGVAMYEETVTDVFIYQLSHNILIF